MPLFKTSLQARVIASIVITVTVSSFLFAFTSITIKDRLEEITFGNMVGDQLQFLLESDPHDQSDNISLLQGWDYRHGSTSGDLPEEIRTLPPGSHHSVIVGDQYFQVEIADIDGERFYLTYDISEWEEMEHEVLTMLGYGVGLVLVLAILVAWLSTRTSLSPLRALTQRLAAVQPTDRNLRIGQEFKGNEVGQIADEFDRYLSRLDEFVEREKFFTAASSHELRTPLSVVIGATDVIEAQQNNPATERAVERIRRACGEMLSFIEVTLFLAREESNPAQAESGCEVARVVEELLEELEPDLQERQITVDTRLAEPLTLPHSPGLLKMVISNILRNAIEHTRAGTLSLDLEHGCLRIEDSGEGISEENLQKIFDRSFTTKAGGTGLGLSLVGKICDRLGWEIEVESSVGSGTTVTLKFDPA